MSLTPLNLGMSGTVASDGTLTMTMPRVATSEFAAVLATFLASGNPTWILSIAGKSVGNANGPAVDIGPRLCAPNENVQVSIIGGLPGTPVQGQLHGARSPDMKEVVSFASLVAANQVSILVSNQRQKLFPDGSIIPSNPLTPSFTVGGGVSSGNQRFTLPKGTVQVRMLVSAGGLLFSYSMLVTGHQTNEQYWGDPGAPGTPFPVPSPTLPFTISIEGDWDSQLDVILNNTGANAVSVFVSAILAVEPPGQAGATQAVNMPSPAPWQAPTVVAEFEPQENAGASANLIAPLTGITRYLHTLTVWMLSQPAGVKIRFYTTPGGTIVAGVPTSGTGPWSWDFRGAPLPGGAGQGLKIQNDGSVNSDFMPLTLTYS